MPDSSPEGACARALTRQALVRAYSAAPPAVRGLLAYLVCASFDLTEQLLDGRVLNEVASSLPPSAGRAAEVCALGLAVRKLMRKDAEAFPRDDFAIHFHEVFTAPLRAYAAEDPTLLRLIESAAQMIGLLLTEGGNIDADLCALLEEKLLRLGADKVEIRRRVRVLDDLMRFLGAVSETVGEDFPAHPASEAELLERLESFTPDDRGTSLFLLRSLSAVIFETVGESETELGKRLAAAVLLPSVRAALFAQAVTVRKILPEFGRKRPAGSGKAVLCEWTKP